jgi:hypothetical protein
LGMGVSLAAWLYFGKELSNWILLPIGVIFGGGIYAAILWILRVPELTYMTNSALRRLKR